MKPHPKIIDKIMTCEALPQAARGAMHEGYETLRRSWANLEGDARTRAGDGCRAAADALRQAAASMGCDLL